MKFSCFAADPWLVRCSNRRCRAFMRQLDAHCPVCRAPREEDRCHRAAAVLLFRLVLPALVVGVSLGIALHWRARNAHDLQYSVPDDPWRSVPAKAVR